MFLLIDDIIIYFLFVVFFYVQICVNWEGFSDEELGIVFYIVNVWILDSGVIIKVVNDIQFFRIISFVCFDLVAGNYF